MRVHLVMILNQLLDGQHGKSVGGLFEKVSNSLLLTDMPCQPPKKSRPHYSKMADCTDPERQSTDCTVREMDDVMDILVQIDERKVNCLVHCLVLLLTTLIIYRRLIWVLVKCIPP